MVKRITRTGEGIPVGTSREEERLEELAEEGVLQNTSEGYVRTGVDEIPLSDKAGEGRRRRRGND